jgi:ubiquinone/menaquinone biosynthesis C-methylase UbiE
VGFYRHHVLPRLINRACGTPELSRWRQRITADLHGRVVEIGFGSGLNLPHYPAEATEVLAVEPSEVAWRLARPRIEAAAAAVTQAGLDGQTLAIDDSSCDAAISTFTLCTIPDAPAALAELRRVVRPGGRFTFLEHGRAPDPEVEQWQHRLEPLQRRLADGCHLTRDPVRLVTDAGFEIEWVEQRYARGPRPWSWFTAGSAVNPG